MLTPHPAIHNTPLADACCCLYKSVFKGITQGDPALSRDINNDNNNNNGADVEPPPRVRTLLSHCLCYYSH